MIVGTVGHIDHGKTALVRALTGIDGDRLPEEKRRGITVELGYAWMPAADGQLIGFIDMPGHEKLVRTMVAGTSAIDYGLLLIAADDGIMPQTLEHLTILSLLGVRRSTAVITKIDKADKALLQQRQVEVRALLAAHRLDESPIMLVSAMSGQGVDALRTLLLEELKEAKATGDARVDKAGFRMGLDRVFTLDGVGTVVAGSIAAGSIQIGASLCLAHAPERKYRVRVLHVHNRSVEHAYVGQRCAVGLASLDRADVERGQMLCEPGIAQSTRRIDVWLQLAASEEKVLFSGTQVHLHLVTQDCLASVAILGQQSIAPGKAGLAQLILQREIHTWQGDRFILRDSSATRTMAGGNVLDVRGPVRYRQTLERIVYLHTQHDADDAAERFQGALAFSAFGIHGRDWLRSAGLRDWPFDPLALEDIVADEGGDWVVSRQRLSESERALKAALEAFHEGFSEDIGPDRQRLRRLAVPRMPESLWNSLVDRLCTTGVIGERNFFLHLPEHGVQLLAAEKIVAKRLLPLLCEGRFDPPWVRDLAGMTDLSEKQLRVVMARMTKAGELFQIVKDLYYHPDTVKQLFALARSLAYDNGSVTAADYRDATGLGRKRAIQILEFFDRIGLLRRVGDKHLLRPGTGLFPDTQQ